MSAEQNQTHSNTLGASLLVTAAPTLRHDLSRHAKGQAAGFTAKEQL